MPEEGGAEAVVDIDDGDAGGAGGKHGVEGGLPFECGSVADGGGNCDDGAREKPAEDAGEGSFHSGDGDDGGGVAEGVEVGEDAVDTCYSDVGDLNERVFEKLEGGSCFVRNREVGGSGGNDGDIGSGSFVVGLREAKGQAAGGVVIVEVVV